MPCFHNKALNNWQMGYSRRRREGFFDTAIQLRQAEHGILTF